MSAGDQQKISVASLASTAVKQGFLTKQGGSIKTWKRRWMVLSGATLYYFKTQQDADVTGLVRLESDSSIREEPSKSNNKKKFAWSVGTRQRTYYIYADTSKERQEWMDALQAAVKELQMPSGSSGGGASGNNAAGTSAATADANGATAAASTTPNGAATADGSAANADTRASRTDAPSSTSPSDSGALTAANRRKLEAAKDAVAFLADPESKVLEFWQIWCESIPTEREVSEAGAEPLDFTLAMSADGEKLTWRTSGPQNLFIQKMVDFFWNVGAPESEIDRLNDVGSRINPGTIGSWIDMSKSLGMDGGWYFPDQVLLNLCLDAADDGEPTRLLSSWAEKNKISDAISVGRDMGAAPPRQTEVRLELGGRTVEEQIRICVEAPAELGFPSLPDYAESALRDALGVERPLRISLITSADKMVRLGILQPTPSVDTVASLLAAWPDAAPDALRKLETAIGAKSPEYVEYQYLMKGFGYGVYREGFDIVFHYKL